MNVVSTSVVVTSVTQAVVGQEHQRRRGQRSLILWRLNKLGIEVQILKHFFSFLMCVYIILFDNIFRKRNIIFHIVFGIQMGHK